MNRDYKVGDWVIYIDKLIAKIVYEYGDRNEFQIYKKLAKIIYIYEKDNNYLIEFKDIIGKDNGLYTRYCEKHQIKSAVDSLKFKKWVKG